MQLDRTCEFYEIEQSGREAMLADIVTSAARERLHAAVSYCMHLLFLRIRVHLDSSLPLEYLRGLGSTS